MSQMQNVSPQGIAGLMQKPPAPMLGQQSPGQTGGQPQMPSPNKASPMAGLGSVGDRVSAYQGNTKPLEQRYAMTQDLLDLLALQQIKSQKDAAARQMQLQMAQQQAQNGEASMTVAQQREKEVTDLTKNELAQQRGETAQKQTSDQQAMMQKLVGGIAGAPGAATAAQPMAMAAGGIVGYAGPAGSSVEDPRRKRLEGETPTEYSRRMLELDLQLDKESTVSDNAAREMERQRRLAERGGAAIPPSRLFDRKPLELPGVPAALAAPAAYPDEIARRDPPALGAAPTGTNLDLQRLPPPPPRAQPAAPKLAAPPAALPGPAPGASANMVNPMASGLGSIPAAAAAGAEGAPPAVGNFGDRLKQAAIVAAEIDDVKRGRDEEKYVTDKMALKPEERKVYDEGIAGLQGMYKEQYDPERQRQEGLQRFLIGAGGRRYGEFGAGAAAAMDYDAGQRAAKIKEFGDIQNARTGLIGLDRGAVKSGLDAGAAARKEAGETKRSGLTASSNIYSTNVTGFTNLYNTDATTRSATLDREINREKNHIAAEANKLARENLGLDKARTFLGMTQNNIQKRLEDLDKNFKAGPAGILMMGDPAKLNPEDKKRLIDYTIEHEKNKARFLAEMNPVLESAKQKLGIATDSNLTPAQKAVLDKYAPKAK